ncbi:flagellar filament capping protein FliD [Scandinavium sp. NPDC088450]|uniref:flagellar filament capping protein FliD n=1 Tax=Scandinavium sp. NPDC088450 TaxID=3364514 RepID=UPI00384B34DC
MTDISSIDPQTLAQQMASYDIMATQDALSRQTTTLKSQQDALTKLKSALTDFRTAMNDLNKSDDGMLKTTATMNQENIASITTNSNARKGTYSLDVTQMASAQQIGYADLTDDAVKNATGDVTITLGQGDDAQSFTVNMDEVNTLGELTAQINGSEDNPGVTASLVRTDGNVTMMLSSDETGAKNTLSMSGAAASLFDNGTTIAEAQDAQFSMGSMQFTNSTNTLDGIVDGVTIDLAGTTEPGKPLVIKIGTDTEETKNQAQAFVDAYNTLESTLDSLTKTGSDGTARGAFAGDANMMALDNTLNNVLRQTYGDHQLNQFGITAGSDGTLEIDSDKLEAQLSKDPESFTDFFNGSNGMLKSIDKSLDRYLSSTDGLLKGQQETLDRKQSDIDTKTDAMNTRYDNAYNRYLTQFTQLQTTMQSINNTMSMFGLA